MRSRDREFAEFALREVLTVRDEAGDGAADFRRAVEELPALLRTNGLGQAAAYLKGEEQTLYQVMQGWLCGAQSPVQALATGDLLGAVRAATRAEYMDAVDSAWVLSEWLKPLAVAYLPSARTARAAAPAPPDRDGSPARAPSSPVLPWYGQRNMPPHVAGHSGLLYDRFCDRWDGNGRKLTGEDKKPFFEWLVKEYRHADTQAKLRESLDAALARRRRLLAGIGGQSIPCRTTSRLVTGLGMTHVLQTGFLWHPTLGVPYLPGSSVKGLIRTWFDPDKGWAPAPTPEPEKEKFDQARRLFGGADALGVGSLVVFEALPVEPPLIDLDVMNVHYKEYYAGTGAPSDDSGPTLIHFLAIAAGARFEFALAPRPGSLPALGSPQEDLTKGLALLREALEVLGTGAKTAAGYGRFVPEESEKSRR